MKNTTDITNVSDRVLDAFLSAKTDPETAIAVDDWTQRERRALAFMMGWDFSRPLILDWINNG